MLQLPMYRSGYTNRQPGFKLVQTFFEHEFLVTRDDGILRSQLDDNSSRQQKCTFSTVVKSANPWVIIIGLPSKCNYSAPLQCSRHDPNNKGLPLQCRLLRKTNRQEAYSLRPISTSTKASSGARHWHFTKTSCGIDYSLQTILMCEYE